MKQKDLLITLGVIIAGVLAFFLGISLIPPTYVP